MQKEISQILSKIIHGFYTIRIDPQVEIPSNLDNGDYSTNVAMVLAQQLHKNPIEIAKEIVDKLSAVSFQSSAKEHDQIAYQTDQKVSDSARNNTVLQDIEKIEVAAPGFINFWVSASNLSTRLFEVLEKGEGFGKTLNHNSPNSPSYLKRGLGGVTKKIMVEFAHPNTHKAFHIGHLRNITTGESIVRLLESQGMKVIRANYQGDVGMHIAKCLYSISRISNFQFPISNVKNEDIYKRIEFLGKAYAAGSKAYEESDEAKREIGEINKQIYAFLSSHPERSEGSRRDSSPETVVQNDINELGQLYQTTRQWSLDYFENIYKRVGSHYDRYYFESEVYEPGKLNTLKGLEKGIFKKSEGAIIFPGKKYGLHNRVFITSEDNPTYEGKDMGLGPLQFKEYKPELIIHVVGPEQAGYFQVVFEALAQLFPETRGREYHLIYGWVKLKQGKMSSRTGNVVLGEWLIDEAKKALYNILERSTSKDVENGRPTSVHQAADFDEVKDDIAEKVAIAAVKYSFLKVSTKQEIAFDIKESVSFEGDSGPYLQYTYARCRSVLRKADSSVILSVAKDPVGLKKSVRDSSPDKPVQNDRLYNQEELNVMRLIYKFPEIIKSAADNYAPNILCKYLYDLASSFNTFYNKHSILDSDSKEKKKFRLSLTDATSQVIKNGLYLLGIETLERM